MPRKGEQLSEEQREKLRERLKLAREAKAARSGELIGDEPDEPEPQPEDVPDDEGLDWTTQEPGIDRRERLLEGIDPEIAKLITDAELDQIEEEEREKAEAERKKKALGLVRDSLRQKARLENDLIDASVLLTAAEKKRLAEPVTFKVQVPGDGAGHHGQAGFRVDGFLYQNGRTYTRPRAVFDSLQANHYRTHLNEIEFRTLDQHKQGNSAREVLARTIPQFEVTH